jgi:LysR family transcriptional regulator, regulator for bpeEF and oprC
MRDLNALATFVAVVRLNSFALAAEHCGISRAMVTKQIQTLETSLGVRLLHRTTRRLGLTQAGERFFERCVRVLEQAEDAVRDLEDEAGELHGLIRVSTGIAFGRLHVLPAVAAFMREHPAVRFDVTLSEQFADLVSGRTDLVVRMADTPRLSQVVARKLAPARFVLAASAAYLASVLPLQVPADLRRCNCLHYAGMPQQWRLEGPQGIEEIPIGGNFQANNADGLLEAALAGLGIGILPSFAASPYLKRKLLVPVLPGYRLPERTLYAMFLPDRRPPQRIAAFVRFLVERFGPQPYWDDGVAEEGGAVSGLTDASAPEDPR